MDLFKLVGKFVIEGSDEAKKDIQSVGDSARQTASTIDNSNKQTTSSNKSTGSSWGNLKSKVADYKKQGMTTSQAWKQASLDMKKTTETSSNGMVTAFKKVGVAIGSYLTIQAIKDFGLGCLQAAADANAMESQFSQVFGDLESKAQSSLSGIASEAGITENRMKGSFTKIAAFAKTTGMETEDALGLAERAMIAVADSAAFYDRTLEETTESLQSFLKGNYENDAALGLSCTETTRNAAANELYGKSFKDLSEEQKQLTLLKMVEDANKLSGALGQASRESDTWTNVIGNLRQTWTDFKGTIGKHVLPAMTELVKKFTGFVQTAKDKVDPAVEFLTDKFKKLKNWLSELGSYASSKFQPTIENLKTAFDTVKDGVQPVIDKFSEYVTGGEGAEDATNFLKDAIDLLAEAATLVTDGLVAFTDWCSEHQGTIENIALVVGSFAAAWGLVNGAMKIWNAVGIVSTAVTTGFASAMAFLTSPVTLTVAAIGAVIAIGVLLWKNWDTIKEKCKQFGEFVSKKFNELKDSVTQKVTELKDKAVAKWEELKTNASNKVNELKTNAVNKFNELKTNAVNKVNDLKTSAVNKFNELKTGAVQKFTDLKSSAVGKFEEIKSSITEKIQTARDKVSEAVEKIKGFFKFEWGLPKPKIPGFSVSGGKAPWGFMGQGSLPKVSITWFKKAYDQAMVLNEPTIFGYSAASGKYLGGGDGNGREVISGETHLMNMIQSAVAVQNEAVVYYLQKLIKILADYFPQILEGMENPRPAIFDPNHAAAVLAVPMDYELGKITTKKGRGR
jgi:hypothetical protein